MIPSAILRFKNVMAVTGYARSSIYWRIYNGLFPRPVQIGKCSVGWPAYEIEAINKARIEGKSDEEIRVLVKKIIKKRTKKG